MDEFISLWPNQIQHYFGPVTGATCKRLHSLTIAELGLFHRRYPEVVIITIKLQAIGNNESTK